MKNFAISIIFIIIIASQHFINWMWRSDWTMPEDTNEIATKLFITLISLIGILFGWLLALKWYKEE